MQSTPTGPTGAAREKPIARPSRRNIKFMLLRSKFIIVKAQKKRTDIKNGKNEQHTCQDVIAYT
jgi:hypothetical protein